MKPDSSFSKRIRPGILVWLTFIFTFSMFADGNLFDVCIKDIYVSTLGTLMGIAYGAYFVAKSTENAFRINSENKKEKENDTE